MRGQPGTFLYFLARRLTRIQVHGEENLRVLDAPGPAMLVINHTTVVDVVVVVGTLHKLGFTVDGPCNGVCSHRRHLRPVGTSDMWNFPLAKQIVTGSGIIPTDQHDGRSAYRAARTALQNNECVLMYPEGDVQINSEASPRPWRPGAAALAKSVAMPILPIAHHDTRKLGSGSVERSILQALSKVFRRPTIHLLFGTPVIANEIADLSMQATNDYLEAKLNETWQQVKSFN
ncbi:MAG: lysophospholipid acyltransferase family protein [Candidatus Nanopelagicales bacterium]|jgi:1-acyl-sn-glycerol-3-phosphate acyltransferase